MFKRWASPTTRLQSLAGEDETKPVATKILEGHDACGLLLVVFPRRKLKHRTVILPSFPRSNAHCLPRMVHVPGLFFFYGVLCLQGVVRRAVGETVLHARENSVSHMSNVLRTSGAGTCGGFGSTSLPRDVWSREIECDRIGSG